MIQHFEPRSLKDFKKALETIPKRSEKDVLELNHIMIDLLSVEQLIKAAKQFTIVLRGVNTANLWRQKLKDV